MTLTAVRWKSPSGLAMLSLATLAALLAFREVMGVEADPLQLITGCFAAIAVLVAVARYPAAFIAPVLFLPRLKEVPSLSGFGPAGAWTALEIACGLVAIGAFLRWAGGRRGEANPESYPGYGGEIEPTERGAAISSAGQISSGKVSSLAPGSPVTAFLLFAAVVAFSYLYTAAPHYGSQKLLAFATVGCGLFFAPFLLIASRRDFWHFTVGATLFGLIVAASSLSFSAGGAVGAEDNPAHIGKGQAIGLAILLLLYTRVENRWLRYCILFLCIPALAAGLVSAETRGPLFSLLLVIVLSFFLDSFRSPVMSRKQMAFAGVALIGAVVLLSTFWFYGKEAFRFQYKAKEIINLVEGDNEAKGTAVERLVFYRAALELWSERPVFGWGLGGWSMAYWHMDQRLYPHNLFCEVLIEQGLVGLFALLIFLGAVFRNLRAHIALAKTRLPCLLPGLLYLVLIAMFSGDLDDDRFIWFWCGLTVAGCALLNRVQAQVQDRLQAGNWSADREASVSEASEPAANPAS